MARGGFARSAAMSTGTDSQMKTPSPNVTLAARNLARKIEELRRTNPALARQIEEWTFRLVDGEPLPSVKLEMDDLRRARGTLQRPTVH